MQKWRRDKSSTVLLLILYFWSTNRASLSGIQIETNTTVVETNFKAKITDCRFTSLEKADPERLGQFLP